MQLFSQLNHLLPVYLLELTVCFILRLPVSGHSDTRRTCHVFSNLLGGLPVIAVCACQIADSLVLPYMLVGTGVCMCVHA